MLKGPLMISRLFPKCLPEREANKRANKHATSCRKLCTWKAKLAFEGSHGWLPLKWCRRMSSTKGHSLSRRSKTLPPPLCFHDQPHEMTQRALRRIDLTPGAAAHSSHSRALWHWNKSILWRVRTPQPHRRWLKASRCAPSPLRSAPQRPQR